MTRLYDAYRAVHDQCFMPIFVKGDEDSRMLVDACLEAGCTGIEYTLRREDAAEMIPWIRKTYPDLFLLVGSVIDNDVIIAKQRRKNPQLRTLAEVADMGVDGFVSMLNWSEASIRKYAPTHLVMPTCMTVGEALFQIGAGAHFAKMLGSDMDFVKRARGAAAFDYCPIIVTGGMDIERIPLGVEAGAMLFASGFDLTLKDCADPADQSAVAATVRNYIDVAQKARAAKWPELAAVEGADKKVWLDALPHYHVF
jgi:2-keto-3-deoxy-6-phosphogluconate aldolase